MLRKPTNNSYHRQLPTGTGVFPVVFTETMLSVYNVRPKMGMGFGDCSRTTFAAIVGPNFPNGDRYYVWPRLVVRR